VRPTQLILLSVACAFSLEAGPGTGAGYFWLEPLDLLRKAALAGLLQYARYRSAEQVLLICSAVGHRHRRRLQCSAAFDRSSYSIVLRYSSQ
jgi:hypothetical protein